jgi:hypothetical protein
VPTRGLSSEANSRQNLPSYAVGEFQQAEAYALKVLDAVRKQDYETARNLWFGANSYQAIAHRSAAHYRKLAAEIDRVLRGASTANGSSAGTMIR